MHLFNSYIVLERKRGNQKIHRLYQQDFPKNDEVLLIVLNLYLESMKDETA